MTERNTLRAKRARQAEELVTAWLLQQGFQIVARNLRLGHLEIDIVARQGALIVCVEVRARSARSFTTGFGSIDTKKRERLKRASKRLWASRYRMDPTVSRMRIDAAAVMFTNDDQVQLTYSRAAF